MSPVRVLFVIALAVVMAASACSVTLPSPVAVPTSPPSSPPQNTTAVVATLAATATGFNPTRAPLKTMTPYPSITPMPATATATPFGFVASPTPTTEVLPTYEPPDPAEGFTNDWGSDYRCSLIAKSPDDWTVVQPADEVKVTWTLLNSGVKKWDASQVVLVYFEGAKLTPPSQKKKNLPTDVNVGETINANIRIYAPREPGHYRAVWSLRYFPTDETFCTFTVKILVQ